MTVDAIGQSYLHLFLVAGIVFCRRAHTAVEHVAVPLEPLPAISHGRRRVVLLADVAYRWRDHQLTMNRLVAGVACLLLLPVATHGG